MSKLELIAQLGVEYLQQWRLCNLSDQLLPALDHPQCNKVFGFSLALIGKGETWILFSACVVLCAVQIAYLGLFLWRPN